MNRLLNIDLEPHEQTAYEVLKEYLIQNKHSTLQRREYTKSGEFHFYDACTLESIGNGKAVISIFRSGPDADDFYFHFHEQQNRLKVQTFIGLDDPEESINKIKEVLKLVGKTASERLGQGSHPVATPFGYSLWSSPGKKKTISNFENSISQQVFTRDFSDYCLARTFCLKFRQEKEDEIEDEV